MFKSEKYKKILTFDMILDSPNKKYIKSLDTNKLNNMKFGNEILKFSKILLDIKDIDFSYFYSNIENLETQNIGGLIEKNTRAGYSVRYNFIVFKDYFDSNEIFHELLHLSSSIFDRVNYVEFCGFSQYNYKINLKIGTALNEGYTEYLNEKLFNNNSNVYIIEKNIAKCVEQIVDSTIMKKLFFKANLKELVNILSKYNSMDKTLEFIELLDYISNNSNKFFNKQKLEKRFYNSVDTIIYYLLFTYINKLNIDLNNSSISKDEYDNNLENYINSLGSFEYYSGNKNYTMRFISNRKINKILKKIQKNK